MTDYAIQLTPKSGNRKVGPMPVSTTAAKTCPDECALKANGCYADGGPISIIWRALNKAKPGAKYKLPNGIGQSLNWAGFCKAIAALPVGTIWRHNQAGDLLGINAIDVPAL